MKLFVGNLPYKISESELMSLFSEFGEVTTLKLIKDQFTGDSKGFAFVEMSSRSSGQQAMEALNNRQYESRNLVCNEAKPQKKGKRHR
jgi:RNA recognition motif-containing protein